MKTKLCELPEAGLIELCLNTNVLVEPLGIEEPFGVGVIDPQLLFPSKMKS